MGVGIFWKKRKKKYFEFYVTIKYQIGCFDLLNPKVQDFQNCKGNLFKLTMLILRAKTNLASKKITSTPGIKLQSLIARAFDEDEHVLMY